MWIYQKSLEYPVRVSGPNPKLAKVIIEQYGGPVFTFYGQNKKAGLLRNEVFPACQNRTPIISILPILLDTAPPIQYKHWLSIIFNNGPASM